MARWLWLPVVSLYGFRKLALWGEKEHEDFPSAKPGESDQLMLACQATRYFCIAAGGVPPCLHALTWAVFDMSRLPKRIPTGVTSFERLRLLHPTPREKEGGTNTRKMARKKQTLRWWSGLPSSSRWPASAFGASETSMENSKRRSRGGSKGLQPALSARIPPSQMHSH